MYIYIYHYLHIYIYISLLTNISGWEKPHGFPMFAAPPAPRCRASCAPHAAADASPGRCITREMGRSVREMACQNMLQQVKHQLKHEKNRLKHVIYI